MRPYLRYAIAGTLAIFMGAAQLAMFGVDVTPAVAQPASAAASVADSGGTLMAWGAIVADLLVLLTLAAFVASERRVGYQASRFVRPVEAAKPVAVGSAFDAVDELLTVDATETLVPTSLATSLTERRVEERRLRERQAAEAKVSSTAA